MSPSDHPKPAAESLYSEAATPAERLAVLRILDANRNRAAEGLRVVEEYCRFVLGDAHLARLAKEARHSLSEAFATFSGTALLAARETEADVGTQISVAEEFARSSARHVAAASCERVQQALRASEEYAKVLNADVARQLEALRYQTYTLAKACLLAADSRERLAHARLYVLIDGGSSDCAFVERAAALAAAGVHIVQLRDKRLDDRTLLARARLLRRVLNESPPPADRSSSEPSARPLFIMNDRPDLALLAQADGVHVGQEELSVYDVRRLVGPDLLVGVSTHTLAQARQAVLDGASYLGCGPTFPSGTKHFDHFPGLDFLREVAAEISLPAFAIGGITFDNLPHVLSTGIRRIALRGALADRQGIEIEAPRILAALIGASSAAN